MNVRRFFYVGAYLVQGRLGLVQSGRRRRKTDAATSTEAASKGQKDSSWLGWLMKISSLSRLVMMGSRFVCMNCLDISCNAISMPI